MNKIPVACRLGLHTYSRWEDTHQVTKLRVRDEKVTATGVQQESRCLHCNKLRLRLVTVGL